MPYQNQPNRGEKQSGAVDKYKSGVCQTCVVMAQLLDHSLVRFFIDRHGHAKIYGEVYFPCATVANRLRTPFSGKRPFMIGH